MSVFDQNARDAVAVTKNDTNITAMPRFPCVALYVGDAGTVTVVPLGSVTPTNPNGTGVQFTVTAGTIIPLQCVGVKATGTSCTLFVALYN